MTMQVVSMILVLVCFLCTVLSVVGVIHVVRCREPHFVGLPPARVGRRAPLPRRPIRWTQLTMGLIALAAAVPSAMFAGWLAMMLSDSFLMFAALFGSGVIAIIGTCSAMARTAGGPS